MPLGDGHKRTPPRPSDEEPVEDAISDDDIIEELEDL